MAATSFRNSAYTLGWELARVLEALTLQRYLAEEISLGRLAELLGLNRPEAEAFLDRNNARLPYTREMLEEDRRNFAEMFGRQ